MSSILIKNGHIITMNEGREIIERGDLVIEENKIVEIGKNLDKTADKVINAKGKVVLPGLINAHTHLSMVLFRGIADDLDLQTWLQEKIWPLESQLDEQTTHTGAVLGCLEMIKSGTTCFSDQYFFMNKVAQAVEESGLRATLSYGIIENNDSEKRKNELKIGEELVKKYEGRAKGRIKTMFGPHSTYTCSPKCLKEVRRLAEKYEVGIHTHLAENEKEIEAVLESQGKRPIELLKSTGVLGPDLLAAHCTYLQENEIQLIHENGVKPVHNPVSNMKLGSGIAPIPELLSKGIPVALGTDGAASNNTLDMIKEMKFAALLSKVSKKDPTAVPARNALEMATINGAKALGRENEIGSLEVGKKADIILLDFQKPHLTPFNDVESHVVYSSNGADVESVIVDGKMIMENRKVLTLNEKKFLKKAQKASEELKKRAR